MKQLLLTITLPFAFLASSASAANYEVIPFNARPVTPGYEWAASIWDNIDGKYFRCVVTLRPNSNYQIDCHNETAKMNSRLSKSGDIETKAFVESALGTNVPGGLGGQLFWQINSKTGELQVCGMPGVNPACMMVDYQNAGP